MGLIVGVTKVDWVTEIDSKGSQRLIGSQKLTVSGPRG